MLVLKIFVCVLTAVCQSDALKVNKIGKATDRYHTQDDILNEENRIQTASGLLNNNEIGVTGREEGIKI